MMADNNSPRNANTKVFTNTVPETQNVGIAVFDEATGERVIIHNTTDSFGILSGGANHL